MKITLSMIVKDETTDLIRCLESCKDYVDDIVIINTGKSRATSKIIRKYGKEYKYKWNNNFADARNFALSKVETELMIWLDADDTLEGASFLPKVVKQFENEAVGALWMYYDYDQDSNGNTTMVVWRERILRTKWFKWSGSLHEEALKQVDCIQSKIPQDKMYVKHHPHKDRIQNSAERNLTISEENYIKEHEANEIDPFNVWNYARSLNAVGLSNEAAPIFEEFIGATQSDEHRYQALSILGEIYRKTRLYDKALDVDLDCIKIRPKWAGAYFALAKTYFCMEDWDNVIFYTNLGYKMEVPGENLPVPYDPMEFTYKPLEPLVYALVQKARFDDALECTSRALQYRPDNKYFLNWSKSIPIMIENMNTEKISLDLYNYIAKNEPEKKEQFLRAIPNCATSHPLFVHELNKLKTNVKGDNKVIIYCGNSYDLWDAKSESEGIGGSEEAVINVSRELAKLGWEVEVYNNCLDEGIYDGVKWQGIWKYDKTMPAKVFISWRDTRSIILAPEDSYNILWLHDVCKYEYFSKEQVNKVDKIFVLSKWHRDCLPGICDEKFFVTTNGIDLTHFNDKIKRNPYACIYASSPDRGLETVLNAWAEIKAAVPEAELHVFYGFTKVYDQIHKNNQKMKEFKERIMKLLEQDGIEYYGMVPHRELAKYMLSCNLWLYPTQFTEISCITAMKMQAAGCIPITTTVAALNETVQFGYKVDGDKAVIKSKDAPKQRVSIIGKEEIAEWTGKVIEYLKNPKLYNDKREEMVKWAKDTYSWKRVSEKWSELFNGGAK